MPEIKSYIVVVEKQFEINGPINHHEAAKLAEERCSEPLNDADSELPGRVRSARIISVNVRDVAFKPPQRSM